MSKNKNTYLTRQQLMQQIKFHIQLLEAEKAILENKKVKIYFFNPAIIFYDDEIKIKTVKINVLTSLNQKLADPNFTFNDFKNFQYKTCIAGTTSVTGMNSRPTAFHGFWESITKQLFNQAFKILEREALQQTSEIEMQPIKHAVLTMSRPG